MVPSKGKDLGTLEGEGGTDTNGRKWDKDTAVCFQRALETMERALAYNQRRGPVANRGMVG